MRTRMVYWYRQQWPIGTYSPDCRYLGGARPPPSGFAVVAPVGPRSAGGNAPAGSYASPWTPSVMISATAKVTGEQQRQRRGAGRHDQ